MRKKLLKILLTVLSLFMLWTNQCPAGPFGTQMGEPAEKYTGFLQADKREGLLVGSKMPGAHKDFVKFVIQAPEKYGMIFCSGSTKLLDKKHADALYVGLEFELGKAYGGVPKIDVFLDRDCSTFTQSDRTLALKHDNLCERHPQFEKVLESRWKLQNRPDKLRTIILRNYQLDKNVSFVDIRYFYEAWAAYTAGKPKISGQGY